MEMLDHQKLVLKNVSTNRSLFEKEVLKSFYWLNVVERRELVFWIKQNFKDYYYDFFKSNEPQFS